MQTTIYAFSTGAMHEHCSFLPWQYSQDVFNVTVPDDSVLVHTKATISLRDGAGESLSAKKVLAYCRRGMTGYHISSSIDR